MEKKDKYIRKFRCTKCGNLLGGTLKGGIIGHLNRAKYYTNYLSKEPEAIFLCKICNEKFVITLKELREQEKNN